MGTRLNFVSQCRASKYLELQEVWEQVGATSVLSIPIPAVRSYESASILEAPAAVEEPASEPATHMSHVLHNSNGAIGVVTVGLATENIDLNGRYAAVSSMLSLRTMSNAHQQFCAFQHISQLDVRQWIFKHCLSARPSQVNVNLFCQTNRAVGRFKPCCYKLFQIVFSPLCNVCK